MNNDCEWCEYWQAKLGPFILCPECESEQSKSNAKLDQYLDEHPLG